MGWTREVARPPSNAEMLKRDYVADRITLDEMEAALEVFLAAGTADDMASRGWLIGGVHEYDPLPLDTETR